MQRMKKKERKGEKDEGRNITLGSEIEVEIRGRWNESKNHCILSHQSPGEHTPNF